MNMFNQLKQLFKESFIYGLSGVVSSAFNFFLLPLYTNILSPSDYGVISIINNSFLFVNLLIIFCLDNSANFWFWHKPEEKERVITFTSWLYFAYAVAFVLCSGVFFFADLLSELTLDSTEYAMLFKINAVNVFFTTVQRVASNLFRVNRKAVMAVTYTTFTSLLTILLTMYFVLYKDMRVDGFFLGQAISAFVVFLISIWLIKKYILWRNYSTTRLREMIVFSLPLIPAVILTWFSNSSTVYFIQYFASKAEVGLYQIGNSFSMLVGLAVNSFLQAWSPYALSVSAQEDAGKIYSKVFSLYCKIGFVACFLVFLLAKPILKLLTNEQYLSSAYVFGIMSFNVLLSGIPQILAIGPTLKKDNKPYANSVYINFCVTSIFFILLIPFGGKEGAALSLLCGSIAVSFYIAHRAQKIYHIPYNFREVVLFGIGTGLCTIAYVAYNMI